MMMMMMMDNFVVHLLSESLMDELNKLHTIIYYDTPNYYKIN